MRLVFYISVTCGRHTRLVTDTTDVLPVMSRVRERYAFSTSVITTHALGLADSRSLLVDKFTAMTEHDILDDVDEESGVV
jgi:hypothetical protein